MKSVSDATALGGAALDTIRRLEARIRYQEVYIATLKAAAVAAGSAELPDELPAWAEGLTAQEAALLGVLASRPGRVFDKFTIDEALPHQDHAAERQVKLVDVVVCKVRKKKGADWIETVWARGYRAGPGFLEVLTGIAPVAKAA